VGIPPNPLVSKGESERESPTCRFPTRRELSLWPASFETLNPLNPLPIYPLVDASFTKGSEGFNHVSRARNARRHLGARQDQPLVSAQQRRRVRHHSSKEGTTHTPRFIPNIGTRGSVVQPRCITAGQSQPKTSSLAAVAVLRCCTATTSGSLPISPKPQCLQVASVSVGDFRLLRARELLFNAPKRFHNQYTLRVNCEFRCKLVQINFVWVDRQGSPYALPFNRYSEATRSVFLEV
jgi:hypothetical protein